MCNCPLSTGGRPAPGYVRVRDLHNDVRAVPVTLGQVLQHEAAVHLPLQSLL